MLLDDLVFRLVHTKSENWDGPDHFMFYKVKGLVDQYEDFFSKYPGFAPSNIFELGIFDGGSAAFWNEVFQPKRLVAIDFLEKDDSNYFKTYLGSRGLTHSVSTRWGVDQSDRNRLLAIASSEFDGPIDLVIDDCSHLYGPTLASFEALFPLVRPGGFYIIEDWAWAHEPEFGDSRHALSLERPLSDLVMQIAEATGGRRGMIRSVTVRPGFVVVERGNGSVPDSGRYQLKADAAPRRRWITNLNLQHLPMALFILVRHWGKSVLPRGSAGRRWYKAARRAMQSAGILRANEPEPPSRAP